MKVVWQNMKSFEVNFFEKYMNRKSPAITKLVAGLFNLI